jgi:hypothetical protein
MYPSHELRTAAEANPLLLWTTLLPRLSPKSISVNLWHPTYFHPTFLVVQASADELFASPAHTSYTDSNGETI